MRSSDAPGKPLPNIPAPAGSRSAASYSRIIPAEELGDFAAWQPGALGTPQQALARRPRPRAEGAATGGADAGRDRVAEARKAGYQDGYRDGLVGLDSFKQSHAAQVQAQSEARLAALMGSLESQWAALEGSMAQTLARAAVRLARQVLRHELRTQPEHVLPLAQEAVQAIMQSARRIELHVHPDDHALVQAGIGEMLAARNARLVADTQVERGGCRVQSDIAAVDATLGRRWTEAASSLGSDLPWDGDGDEAGDDDGAGTGEARP